jgi:Na+-translocating ferredoxin:NAD+ oxidoreductase subunit C
MNPLPFHPIATPKKLQVPLSSIPQRHAPATKPIGTSLSVGDLLCESRGESDAAPLSPRAGTIIGTTRVFLCNGTTVDALEIETTADAESLPSAPTPANGTRRIFRTADLGLWIDRLLAAGVSAARVGCPDLVSQLYQSMNRPIDTVLCCVLDSDPSLPINATIARAFSAELAAGIDLLSKLLGSRRVWVIADPGTSAAWFASLDPLIRADGLRLIPLRNDYPQADPTLLLHTLLRRKLRPGRLPVEQGVLLLDAAAAVAIGYRLLHDRPMLDLPIAVRDHVRNKTHFLLAPVGTSLNDICRHIGAPPQHVLLRGGELLRDFLLPIDAVIGPGELAIHLSARELDINPDPCVRCGWCIEACPTRIHPVGLLEAAQHGDEKLARRWGIDSCIECGICTYVCPSQLPLLEAIRELRLQS